MSASITYHPPMYTAMLYLRHVTAEKLNWFSTWYNCSCRLVVYGAVQTVLTNSSSTSKYLACRTKALVPKRTDLVGYGTTFTTKRDLEDDFGFISCTRTSTNIFLKLTRPLSSVK